MRPANDRLQGEIVRCFGFVPPLLASAEDSAGVLEGLWQQTLWGYVNNPLPSLFKDKLAAYLSRYCSAPYCIVCHSCALRGLGMTGPQILTLLKRPAPRRPELRRHLALLESLGGLVSAWPARGSVLEESLFCCAVQVFLEECGAGRCRAAMRKLVGEAFYGQLISLLSYIKACHLWSEAHPELSYEQDQRVRTHLRELLREEPRLAEFLAHYQRKRWNPREKRLLAELARHDQTVQSLRESELRFRHAVLHAPFPIMIYAEDGEVLQMNHAWSQLTGYTMADIPTVTEWMRKAELGEACWVQEDVASLDGWDGAVEEGEYAITTKDGVVRTWEFSSALLGRLADGRRAVMRAAVDLSGRKRLETALWETNRKIIGLLEAITDGFAALDREWRFLYLNRTVERLTGRQREQLIGRIIWEEFPELAQTGLGAAARRAVARSAAVHGTSCLPSLQRPVEFHLYPSDEGLSVYLRDAAQGAGEEESGGGPRCGLSGEGI